MTNSSSKSGSTMVLITGNTFPVKDQIKALGGRWNAAEKGWMVPKGKAEQAKALVAATGGRSGYRSERTGGGLAFKDFVPTAEQAVLRDYVLSTKKNLFIAAGAGCGKTTVSLWLLSMLEGTKAMIAFGKDIQRDIEKKAPGDVEVVTMNALGFRAYKAAKNTSKIEVDGDYLFTVFRKKFGDAAVRERSAFFGKTKKLIDIAKGALAETTEDLEILAADFDLDLNGEEAEIISLAQRTMEAQKADTSTRSTMDYSDQLWLAVVQNLRMPQFDILVIDESQDTNALNLEALARCVKDSDGRVIAVGDKRQAIFGFRGADSQAVDKIVARFDMEVLPLMTTFRCGKAIVREAQRIVPEFKAGENNHEGLVRDSSVSKLLSEVKAGDFVLSRTNAPLVAGCIRALAAGIPAMVAGRDVGGSLLSLAKKLGASSMTEFDTRLAAWLDKEIQKIERKVPVREAAIEIAQDKASALRAIADSCDSVQEIYTKISALFSEKDPEKCVVFTSTHKAKGRERDTVYLFADTFMKRRLNRKTGEWIAPSIEEENLYYVGMSRAKNELVFIRDSESLVGKK